MMLLLIIYVVFLSIVTMIQLYIFILLLIFSEHDMSEAMWTKLPGQVNRIPNKLEKALPTGRKGCSAVRFSHDGR